MKLSPTGRSPAASSRFGRAQSRAIRLLPTPTFCGSPRRFSATVNSSSGFLPSLPCSAAVYVFYRCARELFDWDVSLIATMLFILPRGIAFAAIDVRPYPFALLVTNLTIFLFLRWMKNQPDRCTLRSSASRRQASSTSTICSPAFWWRSPFIICSTRRSSLRADLRQIGIALGCFAIFLLPVLPRLKYIYQTRTTHSFAAAPQWASFLQVLNPGKGQLLVLAGVILLAAVARQLMLPRRETLGKLLLCVSLALVPILCLYAISVTTSVHVFIPRYLLVAVPGISLCWGWLCSLIDSRALRGFFCFAFVALCSVSGLLIATLAQARRIVEGSACVCRCQCRRGPCASADVQPSGGSRLSADACSRQRERAVFAFELLQSERSGRSTSAHLE